MVKQASTTPRKSTMITEKENSIWTNSVLFIGHCTTIQEKGLAETPYLRLAAFFSKKIPAIEAPCIISPYI
jgi:hypothetical protein